MRGWLLRSVRLSRWRGGRLALSVFVSCLLLLLLIGRPQPPMNETTRLGPAADLARGPVHQQLPPIPAELRQLDLGQVMSAVLGTRELEALRRGQMRRPARCPPRALIGWAGGRTGNVLFEYMGAWSLAQVNGLPLLVPDRVIEELEGVFPNVSGLRADLDFLMMDCADQWNSRRVIEFNDIHDTWLNVGPMEWVQVVGYPCNITGPTYEAMHSRAAQLREELRFSEPITEVLQSYLHRVREALAPDGDITYIGVHVRRTDYHEAIYNMEGVWMHMPDELFFTRAFSYYRQRYNNVVFVVASDDMPWCRQHLTLLDPWVLMPGGLDHPHYLDMALLANCNHTVVTLGTFALSGALLAAGEMVAAYNLSATYNFEVFEHQNRYWPYPWRYISVV